MRIGTTVSASKFNGKIEAFLDEYLLSEEDFGAVPFGGRDEELEYLDAWLTNDQSPARLVIAAPAGRGKSALLVRWIQRLNVTDRVGDARKQWLLAFVPISMRFGTNQPEIFYEALAARLAEIMGEELEAPLSEPAQHYADKCRSILTRLCTEKFQILLVIDGIDEALGESFEANWFPRGVRGNNLRILVSARSQIGDSDALAWAERLGWKNGTRAIAYDLMPLSQNNIGDLLQKTGAPIDVLAARPEVTEQLFRLTEGEPLLLKLYVEDLWKRGEKAGNLTLDELASIMPGFGAYFKDWFRRQKAAWDKEKLQINEQILDAHLAILACAHGPLTATNLAEIAERAHGIQRALRVDGVLHPIRRFIVSRDSQSFNSDDDGYVLNHPKLGEYLRKSYFDQGAIESTVEAFANWGLDVSRQASTGSLQPSQVPRYLVLYFGQHLTDIGADYAKMMELVNKGWLLAWEAQEGGYRGFSQDVRRAQRAATLNRCEKDFNWGERLRCQLVLSSIASLGSRVPAKLLAACVKVELLSPQQALDWIDYREEWSRSKALAALVVHLPATLLSKALDTTLSIREGNARASVLVSLAPDLPSLPRTLRSKALKAANSINDIRSRARALTELAVRLTEGEREREAAIQMAFDAALSIGSANVRALALADLAEHLPRALLDIALQSVAMVGACVDGACALAKLASYLPTEECLAPLSAALEKASLVESETKRSRALAGLAKHLPTTLMCKALELAARISNERARAHTLRALIPFLSGDLLDEALTMAVIIHEKITRVYTLVALLTLSKNLLPSKRDIALVEAFEAARSIDNGHKCAEALAILAQLLPPKLLGNALTAAVSIHEGNARARALAVLIPYLPKELYHRTFTAALAINDSLARIRVLSAIAFYIPEARNPAELEKALKVATSLHDVKNRARALSALSPHLSGTLVTDALEAAMAIPERVSVVRARALIALGLRLPAAERVAVLRDALNAVTLTNVDRIFVDALEFFVPHLQNEVLGDALDTAVSLREDKLRERALSMLVPFLPEPLLGNALKAVRAVGDNMVRSRTLSALASYLPDASQFSALCEALKIAVSIRDDRDRARLLAELAPQLPETLHSRVLEAVRSIHDERERVRALVELIPCLSERHRVTALHSALDAAVSIRDDRDRAQVLAKLAPQLPETLHSLILEAVRLIDDERERVRALVELIPCLSETHRVTALHSALDAAVSICDDRDRARALSELAPRLPEALLHRAVETTLEIPSHGDRALALSTLASYLPAEQLSIVLAQVFEAVSEANDDLYCYYNKNRIVDALIALAPKLSEVQFHRVIKTALEISGNKLPMQTLSGLAPHLSQPLFKDILKHLYNMDYTGENLTHGLIGLAPHLPKALLGHALQAAMTIKLAKLRIRVLASLGPMLRANDRVQAVEAFIASADQTSRSDLLHFLQSFLKIIAEIGNNGCLEELHCSICDVGEWFA